jgi:acetyl esterase/lipase
MTKRLTLAFSFLLAATAMHAQAAGNFDPAAAFGARPSTADLSLSPDGTRVAYIAPAAGEGAVLVTQSLEKGARAKAVFFADGKPTRLRSCSWVADDRLVCTLYGVSKDPLLDLAPWTRLIAVDADGKNLKLLSTQQSEYSRGWQLYGGEILDWLPDENGSVLMARVYLPDKHTGSRLGSPELGLGVDRVDTRTLAVSHVLEPSITADDYITDGLGNVRVKGRGQMRGEIDTGVIEYEYRAPNSRDWKRLGDFNTVTDEGFLPLAVDPDLNVAYGLKKTDGRYALYTVSLDEGLHEQLLFARPDVDIAGLIRIGRRQRVVGASYITDVGHAEYLSPDIKQLLGALASALRGSQLRVADASTDGNTLLIFAGSDSDPGVYYIFNRKARQLQTFLVARAELEGVTLARQKPISYPAGDGVMIPAYLTLPPGREDAKGLPAIVLPHGGPSDRDVWGFDWLSQFFANRGYAVLQPEFRGSAGYGDAWFEQNGFRSWRIAIGDVVAGGHWLVKQGIADPSKLAIVGWSYGGYAALQAAVVDPQTFKAIVAIAPVTDLAALKEQYRHFSNFALVSKYVGEGSHVSEGSPITHASEIKVPVLLFHGGKDTNVHISQSERMAKRLREAGGRCELITWDDLDHQLEDASARTLMLRKSDDFLRQAFGMP